MTKASAYFILENVNDKRDVRKIKRGLDAISGVISVSAAKGKQKIGIDFDTTGTDKKALEKKLGKLGYAVTDSLVDEHVM